MNYNLLNIEETIKSRLRNWDLFENSDDAIQLIKKLGQFKNLKKGNQLFEIMFGCAYEDDIVFKWVETDLQEKGVRFNACNFVNKKQKIRQILKYTSIHMYLEYHNDISKKIANKYPDRSKIHNLIIENTISDLSEQQTRIITSTCSSIDYSRYRCGFLLTEDILPRLSGYQDLMKNGWFRRDINEMGIVKDHMVSIKYGYVNKIDPKLMSHPANCNLISQRENSRKSDNCSITVDELMSRIRKWNNNIDN